MPGDAVAPRSTGLVIAASALGTMFEWYDFFVYGTLAGLIGQHFFPAGNAAVSLLITLATFGVGFGMRPIGAVLFGVLGDRLGRKYTFLVTVAVMGGATAGVGLLPTYADIGIAAPLLLLLLRVAQGLALGGEYGGAAVYVAEHAPAGRRGLHTSFIQAGRGGRLSVEPGRRARWHRPDERGGVGGMGVAAAVPVQLGAAGGIALGAAAAA